MLDESQMSPEVSGDESENMSEWRKRVCEYQRIPPSMNLNILEVRICPWRSEEVRFLGFPFISALQLT